MLTKNMFLGRVARRKGQISAQIVIYVNINSRKKANKILKMNEKKKFPHRFGKRGSYLITIPELEKQCNTWL